MEISFHSFVFSSKSVRKKVVMMSKLLFTFAERKNSQKICFWSSSSKSNYKTWWKFINILRIFIECFLSCAKDEHFDIYASIIIFLKYDPDFISSSMLNHFHSYITRNVEKFYFMFYLLNYKNLKQWRFFFRKIILMLIHFNSTHVRFVNFHCSKKLSKSNAYIAIINFINSWLALFEATQARE